MKKLKGKGILGVLLTVLMLFALLVPMASPVQADDCVWVPMDSGTTDEALRGVWGSTHDDVFAVGERGTILHYDGSSAWAEMDSSTTRDLKDIWGSTPNDVFAVGSCGTILHYDGNTWAPMDSGTTEWICGVCGSAPNDVFAVGGWGTILHYDGSAWSTMDSGTTQSLSGVWGSASDDVFAPGYNGTILHYDGSAWSTMDSGTTYNLNDVWGSAHGDVFAVGCSGTILHYDGSTWTPMDSGTTQHIRDVWGSAHDDVFAPGQNYGTIMHYDGSVWSLMGGDNLMWDLSGIWGSAPDDVFAVGDFAMETSLILRYAPPPPNITVTPTSIEFPDVEVGSSSLPVTVTVANDGMGDLVIGTIAITGADTDQFSIQNDSCSGQTIVPDSSATLEVVFSPTALGGKSAVLSIPSNDPDEGMVEVPLTGTGVEEPTVYYTLTVNIAPAGGGIAILDPPDQDPGTPNNQYEPGTTVTLTAYQNGGYAFSGWSGAVSGGQNPETILINSDEEVTANFGIMADWEQFHGDVAHIGCSLSGAPDTNELAWESDNIGAAISSSPVVANGKVFVNCGDALTCLSQSNGTTLWSEPIVGGACLGSWASPAYHDGRVFISGAQLYCFSEDGGPSLWTFPLGAVDGGPMVADGKVVAGVWDKPGCYYCVNETTGDQEWFFDVPGYAQGTPAYAAGKVYLTSWEYVGGHVYCVDIDTGEEIWHSDGLADGTYGWDTCGSACIADGKVFITTYNFGGFGELVALDASNGSLVWGPVAILATDTTPAYADGRVYVCGGWSGGGDTYCFDASDGSPIWTETSLGVGNWTLSVAVADGKVFVGKPGGENFDYQGIYALDAATGSEIWHYDHGGSSPAVADGSVFTLAEGKVWAFGSTTCPDWDVNCDGEIDTQDIVLVGMHWGEEGTQGWIREDVNNDGTIDTQDIVIIGIHWGE